MLDILMPLPPRHMNNGIDYKTVTGLEEKGFLQFIAPLSV